MIRISVVRVCFAMAAASLGATGAFAQTGPVLRVNAAEIQFNGRVQTQFNTSTAERVPASELILRRVRLEVTVRANRWVSGKVAPDFAGDRVSVKDAYLKLDLSPGFQLLSGKAYRPFSLIEQTSSTRILPIERGLAIRGLDAEDEYEIVHDLGYADRDIGVQVMGAPTGAPLGLSYAAGIFAGPLHRRTGSDATYQYVARATARPLDGVTLGAAWSNRAYADSAAGGRFDIQRGNAFEVDAEIGTYAPGFHAVGELAFGDYDRFDDSHFLGGQAWLAYRTGTVGSAISAVEPLVRASLSSIDAPGMDRGGTLLTPGVNVYFGGLNRMMANYDVWLPAGGGGAHRSFKAQFQMAF
ncbi:MAG: OprO/OprP family phosphate-selective porin [Gemmatimonadetes bacterium]|nr:OprO/OprP family phosphate-selective porin [Gemmatimonadota bacterium]